ncbi:hypothetical protein BS330_38830 [Amycolatopsis keratiniphila subsp. nogabecina]|nr:hypothetical protein BS330_38830 [Amycolatopsis keratiniphila subsp. nogabecina]
MTAQGSLVEIEGCLHAVEVGEPPLTEFSCFKQGFMVAIGGVERREGSLNIRLGLEEIWYSGRIEDSCVRSLLLECEQGSDLIGEPCRVP